MKPLYIVCIIVLLIILAIFVRLGAAAEYSEDGFALRLRLGAFYADFFRLKEKLSKGKKKEKKEQTEKKGGSLYKLRQLLPGILDFLGGFRKKLRIDELSVWLEAAAPNPADAALTFGRAYAVMGAVTAPLEGVFNIKKRDFRAAVSFERTEMRVYLKAEASIRLGQLLFLAAKLLLFILKVKAEKGKAVTENG